MARTGTSSVMMERAYSVLVVSPGGSLSEVLLSLLSGTRYGPVKMVSSVSSAKRAWTARDYDFVIVNSPLSDDPGMRFAIDACNSRHTVALLLVPGDRHGEVQAKVESSGVLTLPKPTTRPLVALALMWMAAMRCRMGRLEEHVLSVEDKMAEIRLVNRAKWLLISEMGMDESDAHRFIEKQAMDRCVTRREIAEEIISGLK